MEASGISSAQPLAGVRQVVADYVTLTKPKVQSLLLLTTITTMYVAGDPSLGLVFATVLGGSLSAGGAGAVNHWYDRDIDAQMARTASRPVPSGRVSPRAALTFGIVLAALSFAELTLAVNLLAAVLALLRLPRLRVRLHDLAEALDAAEHRHRRRRRRHAAARRLGGGAGLAGPDGAVPVRDRLLLDAAALLGAVAADEERVRARRRADDARRPRRGRDAAPDRPLHVPARHADAAAVPVRPVRR